jgi:hypothetical protein
MASKCDWCEADSDFVIFTSADSVMKRQAMPIWRDTGRLLLEVETIVRGFSRYNKYTLGSDLRSQAMVICRLLSQALRQTAQQRVSAVEQLLLAIDDIKVLIQLAKELKAFQNFTQFQRLVELAVAIGKQGGAWLRHLLRKNDQNPRFQHSHV